MEDEDSNMNQRVKVPMYINPYFCFILFFFFPADDMGLGKTLTMIALILAQKCAETEKEKKLELRMSKQGTKIKITICQLIYTV